MIDTRVIVPDSALPYLQRHRKRHRADFAQSMAADYLEILPFLPERVEVILDIGCGMAGVDVLLKRHYPKAALWLLDGDGSEPRDGWNKQLGAFSSRKVANELLALNGIRADRWIDVNTTEALRADLVISLASWGFHYPLRTYDVRGFCIADLRKSEEPARGVVIGDYPKRRLCAWYHKGEFMLKHQGVYLPDGEKHLVEWMNTAGEVVDGKGTYQIKKLRAALAHCKQFRVAIEAGAHCGIWAIQLAKRFEHLYAFEPSARNLECFRANLADRANVTLYPFALGESAGTVALETDPTSSAATWVSDKPGDIEVRTIDSFGFAVCDLLKVDVEGMELFVFRGAEQTLKRCRPTIICEQKPGGRAARYGLTQRAALDYLQSIGYRVVQEIAGDFVLVSDVPVEVVEPVVEAPEVVAEPVAEPAAEPVAEAAAEPAAESAEPAVPEGEAAPIRRARRSTTPKESAE